jgi:hypothetical protein
MTDNHLITPPPELVEQWREKWDSYTGPFAVYIATQAARWGADQELEASVSWLVKNQNPRWADALYAARRPKPPSLKEQALAALGWLSIEPCLINGVDVNAAVRAKYDTIRKALEALPND